MTDSAYILNPNDPNYRQNLIKRINNLSRKNQADRDEKVEDRLVKLRLKLADDYSDPFPAITPEDRFKTDLFAGEKGIPEIKAKNLTTAHLASGILFHGALIVRGLYSSETIDHLMSQADHIVETYGGRRRRDPQSAFILREVYRKNGILNLVRDYIGEEAVMMYERISVRTEHSPIGLAWHQDVNFFAGKCFALNCWAAITPCGGRDRGLAFIPKRNSIAFGWDLNEKGSAPLKYGQNLKDSIVADLETDYPIVVPELAPGDAVLFDEMTLHATHPPIGGGKKQVVTITWFLHHSKMPDQFTSIGF